MKIYNLVEQYYKTNNNVTYLYKKTSDLCFLRMMYKQLKSANNRNYCDDYLMKYEQYIRKSFLNNKEL